MLILSRKINETIVIGDAIHVTVIDIKGDQVKLGIEAPRHVKLYRKEVYDAIQQENREAARSASVRTPDTRLPSLRRTKDDRSDQQS